MKIFEIKDLVSYIEDNNYGPVEMLPSFSTKKIETIYNQNNKYNGEDVVITDVTFENESIRITLNDDGTWKAEFWKGKN